LARISVRGLAKKLGVSPATVSLALNDKAGVSQKTRVMILKSIEELGYEVKLNSRQTSAIGFAIFKKHGALVGNMHHYNELSAIIESAALKSGLKMRDYLIGQGSELGGLSKECMGLVVLATEMNEDDLKQFSELDIPVVFLDNSFPLSSVNTISVDNLGGIHSAVDYLRKMGHKTIGYLKSENIVRNVIERFEGYKKAIDVHGLEQGEIFCFNDLNNIKREAREFFKYSAPASPAFVADDDYIAYQVSEVLTEMGYKVGTDISVMGFGDNRYALMSNPQLSTVHAPFSSFGYLAVGKIMEQASVAAEFHSHILVGTKLVLRKSVKK